ncbi:MULTISPECIES: hypothetical protein [unclassified Pseudoalteromonas]|uniref:hypothetical protein n=1 Tax=unclassified Pseudoalteromonas TaxID=194690 RepID=UPI001F26F44E|nr:MULTISPECIES: hypothetical protein [unclassified Pseudoalteromonas]MCF2825682.1 hypothetical protein [Pseudoalteromonas sp. OF5H-5]MCF2833642.1 hypothetical protein [Pseudoalteromonas sp. DL2-H6]MCF2923758.1 hypothetical protein [Pseudoalteromonas sp. DL2-H1]
MKSLLVLINERMEHYWKHINVYQQLTPDEKEKAKTEARENLAAVELMRCDIATLNEWGADKTSEALQELLDDLLECENCQNSDFVGREMVGLVSQPNQEVVEHWLCRSCIKCFEENGAPGSVIRKND